MAKKMYKALMGWTEYTEGDTKHEPTHWLLTDDEYNKLLDDIRRKDRKIISVENEKTQELQKMNDAAVAYRKKAISEANSIKEQAEKEVMVAKAEAERQSNLNRNLLRITRERSNAKRHLQPKKEHHGYRFSGKIMQTKVISGHDKKTGAIYKDVWTATLESPYPGTIPIHQIEDRICSDLMGENGLFSKLYIKYWTTKGSNRLYKGTYSEAFDGESDEVKNMNYLFDYKFMVNPKSGLWEIQIFTNKSIRALSDMM